VAVQDGRLVLTGQGLCAAQVLDMRHFYNDAVNEPDFNIKEDYKRWKAVSVCAAG